ncbi:MAG: endo-1,4-beta-xylanase [Marinoscillum sp.]|uniref:endo-1,4-beta-xylanase n=1 Tax=Marinoscillum sp. TaxID=2024838 RepID=UPI0032F50698
MKKINFKVNLFTLLALMLAPILQTPLHAQMADGQSKFVGNIFRNAVPESFNTYWNQITPENSGKWGTVEGARDVMNWTDLDLAYNHAQASGFIFKQHTFVWGMQEPTWIAGLTPAEQAAEVEEWIQAYATRYPNTDMIDVVNEPLHVIPSYANAIGGSGSTGWDWVVWSFQKARQYNPNAQLILNDYGILGKRKATSDYIKIINILKAQNLIDGIGVQAHGLEYGQNSAILSSLDDLAATGLPIYISELELDFADDNEQLSRYQSLFPLLYEHPGVAGVTLWGYIAGQHWKPDAYLLGQINSLGSTTVSTAFQDYTFTGSGDIQVHLTNDDVDNSNDLETDYVILDGVTHQAEDMSVNTGVWQDNSCGGSFSQWMNCNGYIQFPGATQNVTVRARGVNGTENMEVHAVDMSVERPALQWLVNDYFGSGSGGGTGGSGVAAEAEDGSLSGTTVGTSRSGYSGTGYVTGFDNAGDDVVITVNLSQAGNFPLDLTYAADGTVKLSVAVNGALIRKNFAFASSSSFTTTGFTADFNAGVNTIRVYVDNGPSGGPLDLDKIKVQDGSTGARTAPQSPIVQAEETFRVFPNPSPDGRFSLRLPAVHSSEYLDLTIYNLQGKIVHSEKIDATLLSTYVNASLPKGMYLLRLRNAEIRYESKLLVK